MVTKMENNVSQGDEESTVTALPQHELSLEKDIADGTIQNIDDDEGDDDDDGDDIYEQELAEMNEQTSSIAEQQSLPIGTTGSTIVSTSISISSPPADVSTRTIRCLEAVITMMIMSAKTEHRVTPNDVRKPVYASTTIADKACQVVSTIINLLRPFVSKKKQDGSDPDVTVFNLSPFVFFSNKILEAVHTAGQTNCSNISWTTRKTVIAFISKSHVRNISGFS